MTPKVHNQGMAVVERDDFGGFLIMFPTGEIVSARDKTQAEIKLAAWAKKHQDRLALNTMTVEWR